MCRKCDVIAKFGCHLYCCFQFLFHFCDNYTMLINFVLFLTFILKQESSPLSISSEILAIKWRTWKTNYYVIIATSYNYYSVSWSTKDYRLKSQYKKYRRFYYNESLNLNLITACLLIKGNKFFKSKCSIIE